MREGQVWCPKGLCEAEKKEPRKSETVELLVVIAAAAGAGAVGAGAGAGVVESVIASRCVMVFWSAEREESRYLLARGQLHNWLKSSRVW